MGSLYSRDIGGNISKGNYIIFLDFNDIVLKEGILKAYNIILFKLSYYFNIFTFLYPLLFSFFFTIFFNSLNFKYIF